MVRGLGSFFESKPNTDERRAESRPTTSAGDSGPPQVLVNGAPRPADLDTSRTLEWSQTLPLRPKTPSSPTVSSKTTRTFSSPTGSAPHDDKTIFARAAGVIQKSVEADGVIFLDASITSFGGLVPGQDGVSSVILPANTVSEVSSCSPTTTSTQLRACHVLGSSVSILSQQGKDDATTVGCIATEDSLQRLLERHPTGAIFNLDEDGSALDSSDDSDSEDAISRCSRSPTGTRRSSRDTVSTPSTGGFPSPTHRRESSDLQSCSERDRDHQLVAYMFPLARSVLLVPLWDPRTKKWVAGSFVWTNSSARRFTPEGELSYLRAFAATIMAEVDRADTLASDRAKSVLLGSLSHELRSPLHGIVAAVELLHDTVLSTFQASLLRSMDSCSRTLLDVIDHLLDYSKINTLVKPGKSKAGAVAHTQPSTTSHAVEVDALVEETVESVLSGLGLQKNAQAQARPADAKRGTSGDNNGPSISSQPRTDLAAPVSVYIDCDPKENWMRQIDAGAVRRLVMNLVGNAFKYTTKGFIKVSLRQKRRDGNASPSTAHSNHLVLCVADSGRGISPEFLRHRAFRPFSQEDVLSPGTGLGLSLVKDIVQGLNGSVEIESQLGQGTLVTISIPMPEPELVNSDLYPSSFREDVRGLRGLRGLRVSLQGFCSEPGACGMASSTPPPTPLSMLTLICREWLGLEIIDPEATDIQPDLVLCAEAVVGRVMAATGASLPPVVVVSDTAMAANSCALRLSKNSHRVVETLSQP